MKTRQKSVRVFEIITDNYEKFVNFVERKEISLRKYLLFIKTNNDRIKEYLNTKNLEVQFVSKDFDGNNDDFEMYEEVKVVEQVKIVEKIVEKKINSTKTKIFDKIIRSGFEIKSEDKLVFLKRINVGAKIYSNKEIELFDEVLGEVVCDGEYMIIKKAKKGSVIFHNEEISEIKKLSFISKDGIKELE